MLRIDNKQSSVKVICIISLLTCILISPQLLANYEITWYSIDNGGGAVSGGTYTLDGTIGQSDADSVMVGGDYTLNGGFLPGTYGCIVNLTDVSNFMYYWLDLGAGIPADLDGDGVVDNVDFSDLAYYWLDYCPAGWQLK